MRLLGKSFRVEYVYKDIHFIFRIYFMGKYYSDDLSVSVSPVKVHKLPSDIAFSNSLAAYKNAITNIYWQFYYSALISAISATFVFLCLFVFFFLERSKMLNIEWKT